MEKETCELFIKVYQWHMFSITLICRWNWLGSIGTSGTSSWLPFFSEWNCSPSLRPLLDVHNIIIIIIYIYIHITHMLHVWNIYQHLPHKSPSHVGEYTIHGALGYGYSRYGHIYSSRLAADRQETERFVTSANSRLHPSEGTAERPTGWFRACTQLGKR